MGLDMYLYRTKKVKGLTADDYSKVDNTICEVPKDAFKSIRQSIKGRTKQAYEQLDEIVKERELIEKVLKETDFKTQVICYRSSW
jgi:hypothetical protein